MEISEYFVDTDGQLCRNAYFMKRKVNGISVQKSYLNELICIDNSNIFTRSSVFVYHHYLNLTDIRDEHK